MLIQTDSQLLFTLEVKLTFDNGTVKKALINQGDYYLLYFRYNGLKLRRACRVADLRPIILDTQPESYTAELIIDTSFKYSAERIRIACKDILNFRKVDKDYIESLAPDFEITDDLLNADAIPPTPEELYMTTGLGQAGVGYAELLR